MRIVVTFVFLGLSLCASVLASERIASVVSPAATRAASLAATSSGRAQDKPQALPTAGDDRKSKIRGHAIKRLDPLEQQFQDRARPWVWIVTVLVLVTLVVLLLRPTRVRKETE